MATISKSSVRTSTASITTSRTTSTIQSSRTTTISSTPSAPGPMRNIRNKPTRRGYGLFYSDDEDDAANDTAISQSRPVPATTSKLDGRESGKQPNFSFKSDRKALFVPPVHSNGNGSESDEELNQAKNLKSTKGEQVSSRRPKRNDYSTSDRATRTPSHSSSKRGQSSRKQPYVRGAQETNHGRRTGFGLTYDHDDDSIELEEKFNAQYAMATDESAPQTPTGESRNQVVKSQRLPQTPLTRGVSQTEHTQSASSSPEYQYNSRSPDGHPTPGGKTSWGQWIKKLIPGSVKKSALSRSADLLEDVDRNVNTSESLAQANPHLTGSDQARRKSHEEEQSFLVPGAFDGLFEDEAHESKKKGSQHNYANSLLLSEVYNSRLITPDARLASSPRDVTISRARYTARPSRRVSTSFTGHDRSTPSGMLLRLPKTRDVTPMKPSIPEGAVNTTVNKRVRRDYVVEAMTEAEKERIQIQKLAEVEQMRRDLAVKLNESAYEERKLRASLGWELPEVDDAQNESSNKDGQRESTENDKLDNNRKRKADQQAEADENSQTEGPHNTDTQQSSAVDSINSKPVHSDNFMDSANDSIPKLPATPTLSHAQLPSPIVPEGITVASEPATSVSVSRGPISPQKSLGYARSQAEKFKPIKSSGLRSSTTISSAFPTDEIISADQCPESHAVHGIPSNGIVNRLDWFNKKPGNARDNNIDMNDVSVRKHIELIYKKNSELYHILPVKVDGGGNNVLREAVEEVWDSSAESVQGLLDIFKSSVIPAAQ